MKKLFALLLAVALLCSLTVVAFAEGGYTITINAATSGHTYEAYQVFAGTLSEDGKLGNIAWGSGVNGEALLEALTNDENLGTIFANCTDAASVADVLSGMKDEDTALQMFAGVVGANLSEVMTASTAEGTTYTIAGVEAGYYFIKDADDSLNDKYNAYTRFILKVTNDTAVTAKMDVPEVEKKIKDTNDTTGVTSDWQDSADYDIGDDIPYQITATLADNVSEYDTYMVKITDTMSKGLTYNDDVIIMLDGFDVTDDFTIEATTDEETGVTTLVISCDDVKALGATNDSVIVVEYTAELNEEAVIGSEGNPNTVYMEYSNNPNSEQEGADEDTGKTPTDTVIAFTYKVVVNKVDESGESLTGAAFKLEKLTLGEAVEGAEPEATWELVKEFELEEEGQTVFDFVGLDDGTYRLTETVTPDGYNTIDPIEFTVTADHVILSDAPALRTLTGEAVTGEIQFTVDDTEDEDALSTTVVNNSGTILPGTGGMGTTLFYIIGGILLLGAVVVLVSKKRVDAE